MTQDSNGLKLKFVGALVEQLGAQQYPSATASVAELISNAWDADAKNVWVEIPLGQTWKPDSEIVVLDDGHGMSFKEARDRYLIVGRKRRLELGDTSPDGRRVHGRKGIGKLAAFGTAGTLECTTIKGNQITAFRLDYDDIRSLNPGEDYEAEIISNPEPLVSLTTDERLTSGTRIRLTNLRLKRALPQEQFEQSMSRRFAVQQTEMAVFLNQEQLQRFDIPTEFRFPKDGTPPYAEVESDEGWAVEKLGKHEVRWWIGFTPEPLEDHSLQGISVLARGKMVQRPFKFERAKGVEGQLGQEYLVGEVEADWLDEGADIDTDLIQANRDGLQLEDERLRDFIKWGRKRLDWALRKRQRLKRKKREQEVESDPDIESLLEPYTKSEKQMFRKMAHEFSRTPEVTKDAVIGFVKDVVDSYDDKAVRELIEQINAEDMPLRTKFWSLVNDFGLIDARRRASIIEARISAIEQLERAIEEGAREVPDIHNTIKRNPWLLDPRWDLLDDEVTIPDLEEIFNSEIDQESGLRLDFLFVLAPRPPAIADQVVVVEIKRARYSNGKRRRANDTELNKFAQYVGVVEDFYQKNTQSPRISGLMVAEDYTSPADRLRRRLEDPITMQFKTWRRVIEDTERFHRGWLEITTRRAKK